MGLGEGRARREANADSPARRRVLAAAVHSLYTPAWAFTSSSALSNPARREDEGEGHRLERPTGAAVRPGWIEGRFDLRRDRQVTRIGLAAFLGTAAEIDDGRDGAARRQVRDRRGRGPAGGGRGRRDVRRPKVVASRLPAPGDGGHRAGHRASRCGLHPEPRQED